MGEVQHAGVVGCGQMGSGIAEVFARAGFDVTVVETTGDLVALGRRRIEQSLERALARDIVSERERDEALGRIDIGTDLDALGGADVVVEAVIEDLEEKTRVFVALDRVVPAGALLCSNTSTIPIMKLAVVTERPGDVVGMHFFNPVPVMPLVELTPSLHTAPDVLERAEDFVAGRLHKAVIHAKDRAGFIVNALLMPYLMSAIRMYDAGFASAEDIDAGMEKGCNHPMGPLRLSDFIGLDVVLAAAQSIYAETKDPAVAPPGLLVRMTEGGLLGRKSGAGFYRYDE